MSAKINRWTKYVDWIMKARVQPYPADGCVYALGTVY